MLRRDIVDEFLDKHRFSYARASEKADLAALLVRRQKVDDLDSGFENFFGIFPLRIRRRRPVNTFVRRFFRDRGFSVDGISERVKKPSEHILPDRHADRRPGGVNRHIPVQPFRRAEHDATHHVGGQMLRHLHDAPLSVYKNEKLFADLRDLSLFEADVHHRSADSGYKPLMKIL